MGVERDTVWDRFKGSETTPHRHQEKEAQIDERTNLRDQVKDVCWRLSAEVAQDNKVGKEDTVKRLVPAWPIANRFNRAVVEPR